MAGCRIPNQRRRTVEKESANPAPPLKLPSPKPQAPSPTCLGHCGNNSFRPLHSRTLGFQACNKQLWLLLPEHHHFLHLLTDTIGRDKLNPRYQTLLCGESFVGQIGRMDTGVPQSQSPPQASDSAAVLHPLWNDDGDSGVGQKRIRMSVRQFFFFFFSGYRFSSCKRARLQHHDHGLSLGI